MTTDSSVEDTPTVTLERSSAGVEDVVGAGAVAAVSGLTVASG